jgi:peptidoglycan/LPS O-acetylase OafA/YrhL
MTRIESHATGPIATLTGVRGFAVLWVVLYHVRNQITLVYPDWSLTNRFIASGYLGLDLFAFLSGFIIAYTYCERLRSPAWPSVRRYLWLRFVRTYPLHLFVLFLFLVVAVGQGGWQAGMATLTDSAFTRQLFLLNGLGLEHRFAWNVPSWSLGSEWACYLLFPALAPLLLRVRSGWLAALLATISLGLTALCLSLLGHPRFDADLDWGIVRIGGEFVTGCWLYRVHCSGLTARWPMGWIGLLAAVLAIGSVLHIEIVPVTVAALGILILALAQDEPPIRVLFGNRVSVYLGEISFSIYMLHWLIIHNAGHWGLLAVPVHWRLPVLLTMIVAAAVLSFHLVEQLSRRRLRNWVGGEL